MSEIVRVSQMLERSAELWPERVALVDGDVRLTYAELRERTRRAAGGFAALGVTVGDRVGFFAAESWQHVVALYGVLELGAVAVPLNLTWQAAELDYALRVTELSFLVAGRRHRDSELWPRLELEATGPQSDPRYPDLRYVLPDWDDGSASLQTVVDAPPHDAAAGDDELAYLMFTSGSTGRPRAAGIRAAAALRVGRAVAERLELTPQDRVLNISPLYHCAGLVAVLLASHASGSEVAIFEGYRHEQMLAHIWETQTSVLVGFDVVTMRLVRGCVERHGSVPIRKMLSGPGRPIFDEVAALGIDLAIMYGLTEASNVVSLTRRDDTTPGRRDTNGPPLPGVDVRIVDRGTGAELPDGQAGEIAYRGWNLMSGYYVGDGALDLELDADGFFHTGDYGYRDEEGRLCYRGRYAGMIKTGGENVSELEVESFLSAEFPWLDGVSVLGLPDQRWGEIVVAVVDVPDEQEGVVQELRERCRGRIAGYKIPKAFVRVPASAWPVSDTGKVLKPQLAALVRERLGR